MEQPDLDCRSTEREWTMGFLVNLCGRFRCVKCGMESEACIQTKLFRSEAENSNREYRVGESELVDGIDDYFPLFPWNGSEPLVVAIGAVGVAALVGNGRNWYWPWMESSLRTTIFGQRSNSFQLWFPCGHRIWTGFTSSNRGSRN